MAQGRVTGAEIWYHTQQERPYTQQEWWFTELQPHCVFATIENVSNIISLPSCLSGSVSVQLQQQEQL